jgi:hypothetical protein
MPQTNVATGTFPSRKAASQAFDRLVSSGFARNSISLHRHEDDEGYDLEIHTRSENLKRAKRLIHENSSLQSMMGMRGVERMAGDAVRTARMHPLVLLGAGVLAGFVLYNLIPRPKASKPSRRKQPTRSDRHVKRPRR